MVKKKLIAIALVCAMSISMAACTDKNGKDGIKTETLSSEEAEQLKRVEFSFAKFNDADDTADDPVEGVEVNLNYIGEDSSSNSDSGNDNSNNNNDNSNSNNDGNNNNDNNNVNNNDNNSTNNNNNNSTANNNKNNNSSTDNNNNNSTSNDNSSGDNNNPTENTVSANEEKQQIFWMDLSGDFVFDGEFANAVFKIKDNAPDGTYPVMIKWLDFSNIKAVSLDATGIDGSVVVGGNATETQFKNDGSFEVKADSVSGKPGDTVTVSFKFKNNPGICASVFRFAYDPDILEFDEKASGQGADFANALATQNK